MLRARVFVALVASIALAIACTKAPQSDVRPDPVRPLATAVTPIAASSSSARADAGAPAVAATGSASAGAPAQGIMGWKDPRAIALLQEDCAFTVPDDFGPLAKRFGLEDVYPNPFAGLVCAGIMEQSCVPDPCHPAECHDGCQKKCDKCSQPCIDKCQTCKAGCTDAACKKRCAESCAECRQACNDVADHCNSADCSAWQTKCRKDFDAKYQKSGCAPVCAREEKCRERCLNPDNADKPECKKCLGEQTPERCARWCMMHAPY